MLAQFRWSSFRGLIGQVAAPDWLKPEDVLRDFGPTAPDEFLLHRVTGEDEQQKLRRRLSGFEFEAVLTAAALACRTPMKPVIIKQPCVSTMGGCRRACQGLD